MKIKKINKIIFGFIFCYVFLFANQVSAATLSLSPSNTDVSVGNIFSEKIVVATFGKAVNNAEGSIQFPTDLLEVVSINKSSSIFSLWVEEPSFSNASGRVTFNGGVPNPGYVGNAGTVATITFRAKKAGTASIIFSDGAVRENDGLGTDILTSKSGSTISVSGQKAPAAEVVPVVTPVVVKNAVPEKPTVVSDTNPNQDIWYKSKSATFSWKIPSGITSIQASLNKTPTSIPTTTYDNSVSQKTISNIPEGKSYFHIRFANAQGYGSATHFRIQIDSVAPKAFTPTITSDGYKNIVELNAKDDTSGIDYYSIKIDELPAFKVRGSEIVSGRYELPVQNQGAHNLVVVAYDKAGNSTEAALSFVSSVVSAPTISVKPLEIKKGDTLTITGEIEYPGQEVEVFTQFKNEKPVSYRKKSTDYGSYVIVTDPIKDAGTLSVWSQISFSDTVKGKKTDSVSVRVKSLEASEIFAKITLKLLTFLPFIISALLILFTLYFGLHKFFGFKRKLSRDLETTATDVHKIFILLKKELNKQLGELEDIKIDRKLNKKEQEIFKKIESKIDDIDLIIEEKLKKLR